MKRAWGSVGYCKERMLGSGWSELQPLMCSTVDLEKTVEKFLPSLGLGFLIWKRREAKQITGSQGLVSH